MDNLQDLVRDVSAVKFNPSHTTDWTRELELLLAQPQFASLAHRELNIKQNYRIGGQNHEIAYSTTPAACANTHNPIPVLDLDLLDAELQRKQTRQRHFGKLPSQAAEEVAHHHEQDLQGQQDHDEVEHQIENRDGDNNDDDDDEEEEEAVEEEEVEALQAAEAGEFEFPEHISIEQSLPAVDNPQYPLPALPRASAFWQALTVDLLGETAIDDALKDAICAHVSDLRRKLPETWLPDSDQRADQQDMVMEVERKISEVLALHNLPEDFLLRFKHPRGHHEAAVGLILFYPPNIVPLHVRTTFHQGSFTMDGFLNAGLTEERLFVMDRYPFSTAIPFGRSIGNRPFTCDPTLTAAASKELWEVLTASFDTMIQRRCNKEGLDLVFGAQAREAYQKAVRQTRKWRSAEWPLSIPCPGYQNQHGQYEAGEIKLRIQLLYNGGPDHYTFGKLVVFATHPCSTAVRCNAVGPSRLSFYEGAQTDMLIDLACETSLGVPAVRQDRHSYTVRAVRSLASPTRMPPVNELWSIWTALRSDEIRDAIRYERDDLPGWLVSRIDAFLPEDPHDAQSLLAR